MKVEFHTQADYDCWLATNPDFSKVTAFKAIDLFLVEELPDLPSCTEFKVYRLPLVTSLPDLPVCIYFWSDDLPLVTALPDLPKCTVFRAYNLPLVTALPELPKCTVFWADEHLHRLRAEKMIEVKKNKGRESDMKEVTWDDVLGVLALFWWKPRWWRLLR